METERIIDQLNGDDIVDVNGETKPNGSPKSDGLMKKPQNVDERKKKGKSVSTC
jgi:hypothetical protein